MITINITCSDFTEASVLLAKCAEGKRLLDGGYDADDDDDAGEPGQDVQQAGERPKRKRRTKAEIEADNAAKGATTETVAQPETVATTVAEQPKPETATQFDLQAVRDALQLVVDKHGMDAARAFIVEQGYERVTAIPEDKFGAFIDACKTKAA